MPRARDPNRDKAFEIYKNAKGSIDLVEIASQLNLSPGTIRGWKSKDKWDEKLKGTFQSKNTERSQCSNPQKDRKKKVIAKEVEEVIENPELTDKQRLFCIYYIRCFNATKAYQKAYQCDYNTAIVNGSRLLGKAKIKKEILELKRDRFNREFISEVDIFQKYMDIAFADATEYVEFGKEERVVGKTKDGHPISAMTNFVDLNESSKVDGTIISEVSQGRDGVKIKLNDRMKALQWLTEHMHMATEEQKVKIQLMQAQKNKLESENSGQNKANGESSVKFYMPDNGRDMGGENNGKDY